MLGSGDINQLLSCELFRHVEQGNMIDFLKSVKTVVRLYQSEKLIMLRGEAVDSLMILLSGRLQAQIQGRGGKTLRIEVLKAPQAVAAGVLFSEDNRLPVSLYSLEDSKVVFIPEADVLQLCARDSNFMKNYFTDMGNKISILAEKIRMFQFKTLRQKIAGYILGLSGDAKLRSVKLVYSKEVLSEIMGVARPSLSRELSNLSSLDIIEVAGKTINILNREALVEIISSEDEE